MISEDEKMELERQFEIARTKLRESNKVGDNGAEQRYGKAYQALVRAGLRQQIRGKYRRGC